jgi:cobyrinic acid a,c-diamide synthase
MIQCPRLIIAGLGGDAGKTAISVGLCRAWQNQGYKVIPFKKGPDYIDMGWLGRGANHPCYNLDLFLMNREQVLTSFALNTLNADIAVIEGNRGLYDGMDLEGSVSTAEIAKLLQTPVILIVNCTKVTRTVAALVLGCQMFDRDVLIQGVILNRLATPRHESIIRKSIEQYCNLSVMGAIPKLSDITFPGRHLGLVPPQEHPMADEAIEKAAETVVQYLNLGQLLDIAGKAPTIDFHSETYQGVTHKTVTIGIIRDSAFQFYYPENIDALRRAGAEIVEFSALTDDLPPEIDALYIGGGFPETHAAQLSENKKLRNSIRDAVEEGLPVYAECGGLMYLGNELIWEDKRYPMAGILPIVLGVSKIPQGHGYTLMEVASPNPFFSPGQILHGHEFHYSYVLDMAEKDGVYLAFKVRKGHGAMNKMDGFCYRNLLATYTHLHAFGTGAWVEGIGKCALSYKRKKLINK